MPGLMLAIATAMLQVSDACNAADPAGRPASGCPAWRPILVNGSSEVSVDPASLTRDGQSFEISMRVILPRPLSGVRVSITRALYDCARRTRMERYMIGFDERGAVVEEAASEPQATPRAPAPGAVESLILDAYCPRQTPEGS